MTVNYPACDFCGECTCCPRHTCENCTEITDPIQWLERDFEWIGAYLIFNEHSSHGFTTFWDSQFGNGHTGPMISLKTDTEELYWRDVHETLETPIATDTAHP